MSTLRSNLLMSDYIRLQLSIWVVCLSFHWGVKCTTLPCTTLGTFLAETVPDMRFKILNWCFLISRLHQGWKIFVFFFLLLLWLYHVLLMCYKIFDFLLVLCLYILLMINVFEQHRRPILVPVGSNFIFLSFQNTKLMFHVSHFSFRFSYQVQFCFV